MSPALRTRAAPHAAALRAAALAVGGALAESLLQLVLSLLVAAAFWLHGEALAEALRDVARRLGGPTAEGVLEVAAGAVRGVAYGVVGTAAAQAGLLGAGLAAAGVPGAGLLGFVAFLLALSQIGAPLLLLVWGGPALWLLGQGEQGWAMFVIALGVFVGVVDNFLKPWLIGLGVAIPMPLLILGVFGGFVAFGFLGLFIGPALIAIGFTLLEAWRRAP